MREQKSPPQEDPVVTNCVNRVQRLATSDNQAHKASLAGTVGTVISRFGSDVLLCVKHKHSACAEELLSKARTVEYFFLSNVKCFDQLHYMNLVCVVLAPHNTTM